MSEHPQSAAESGPVKPGVAELFESEEGHLVRFVCGIVGRRAVAEEIVQEAFLRLHREIDGIENPGAWLFRCARNLACNERRDTVREILSDAPPDHGDPAVGAPERMARFEACGALRLLVAELPAQEREMVELRYKHHLSYAEIASRTGLGIGNVGFKLHHILKHLGAALRQLGIEGPLG